MSPRDLSDDHWQLFHIDEDINERIDLATKNPQKLAEMKALFHKEAVRNNVYPLWPNDRQQHFQHIFQTAVQANNGRFVYYSPGAQRISAEDAPPLASHSHTLLAEVEIPKGGAEGVVAAVGGRTGGYSLFVGQGGKVVFVYNSIGDGEIALQGPVLKPGKHRLSVIYDMTGKTSATAQLVVDDKPAAQAEIARTFSPFMTETLDIGRDTGTPVSDTYAAPFAFTGGLSEVTVDVAKP